MSPTPKRSLSAQELARQTLPAVVLIDCDEGRGNHSLGSGFFIGPDTIVTNYHVVKGMISGEARTVSVGRAKRIWQISVRGFDEDSDLALLSVSVSKADKMLVLPLAKSVTVIGDTIYAFGNPEGLTGTISPGIVSGLRSFKSGERIQITAPISPGSSGGRVVNTRGEVIGIAEGSLTEGQNLNFAIPSSLLVALLSRPNQTLTDYNNLVALLGIEPAPPNADARSWVLVYSDEAGVGLYYVPNEAIRGKNGMVTGWVKMLFPGTDKSSPTRIFHQEWDCGERKDRILHEGDEPSEWASVAPGTINDILFKKVCFSQTESSSEVTHALDQRKGGDNWKYILTFKHRWKLYYSPTKTVSDNESGLVQGWFKTVMPKTNKKVLEMVFHDEFNCKKGMLRNLETIVNYRDKTTATESEIGDWSDPGSYTIGEIMMATVCVPMKR
jgi:Trypsin-like peptidase domain